ncbi:energy-coupling factor ABC transporter permease [Streptomyces sp. NPDC005355]|uniref:energy-coupling factor ABC transporter permease n=1 Tax=Streptomyces sp. NPDC005355 TaxID=3157038 RepID=UPI0033A9D522
MHVPDGFIDAPVSLATGAVAAVAVAVSLRGARGELADTAGAGGSAGGGGGGGGGERTAPLAGLVAAFIFSVQMLNFPVAAGTSGHLLGGALAAILVGPYTGVLCVSVVLLMQGVLFADGGLTALGVNITDMAVVTTVVAYGIFRALLKLGPRRRRTVTVASFVAALVSVPAAAVAFTAIYALGGTTDVPIDKVFTAMVGVHVLIGIGEAAITALTVGAVMAVRPDLVHGARDMTPRPLELRPSPLTTPTRSAGAGAAPAADAVPAAGAGAAARAAETADASAPRPAVGEAGAEGVSAAEPDAAARKAEESHPVAGGQAAEGAESVPAAGAAAARAAGTADAAGGGRTVGAGGGRTVEAGAATGAGAAGAAPGAGAPAVPLAAPRRSARRVWLAGIAAALLCAGVVSFYASASPDGLEKVAHDKGIDEKAEEHAAKDSPLADYGVKDIADARLSGGLAGVIGVGATLAVGSGVFVLVRRRRTAAAADRSETV